MQIERRKISTTKKLETPGFIIYGDIESAVEEPQKPPPPPVPSRPERSYSDAIRAANSRTEYSTHLMEPVFIDGKTTGEWRVYILRGEPSDYWGYPKSIPWDRQFDSRGEAEDWARSAIEYIKQRRVAKKPN